MSFWYPVFQTKIVFTITALSNDKSGFFITSIKVTRHFLFYDFYLYHVQVTQIDVCCFIIVHIIGLVFICAKYIWVKTKTIKKRTCVTQHWVYIGCDTFLL